MVHASAIAAATNLPVSADLENGFGDEPEIVAETITLAAAAGMDAVEFRLRGLSDPRAIEVLQRTAEMIGWQPRPSPNPQRAQGNLLVGRGMAYARYKQAENYVAIAMEVAVDRSSGEIRVRRVTCAQMKSGSNLE